MPKCWGDSTVTKMITLHVANLDSILGTPYGLLSPTKCDF